MYGRFSELYSKTEIEKYNLIRVDSTIVADTCAKLKEGIDQKSGKKLVKFSFHLMEFCLQVSKSLLDKIFVRGSRTSEAILKQVKRRTSREYLRDRQGLQSTRVMKDFDEKSVKFIIRSKENRKFEEIESFLDGKNLKNGMTGK